ncbi:hypothetical protein OG455_41735 [Kitasatospora sp. NBC_01287]|uniref:hypothetical protein n=1 Tax=Kitasatospora sp. NBC_01287 TaxID=2903573 RepID=UPI0022525678|nr:hypothetical protein [Kitasatospora sp. NBC_01287]MCX4751742.1 hypothetical protein [Kitasatospora sp. NBC_01287]MCX4751966.1 hypothetical protein [Kitasatospora sp. NBC_01287]
MPTPPGTERMPNSGVYTPRMFICGVDPTDSVVAFDARPGADIAAALLEEVTDWWQSLRTLPEGIVPGGVQQAMNSLHDAACGWSDWLAHSEKRTPTTPSA